MRDANRQKMYRAEQAVRSQLLLGKRNGDAQGDVTFSDVTHAREWLRTVREILREHDPEPDRLIEVEEITRGTHSWHKRKREHSVIELQRGWGMTGIVLVHEFTHHCMYTRTNAGRILTDLVPDHGGEFCRRLLDHLDIVYTELGQHDVAPAFRDAFDKQRMIYEPLAEREAARRQILRLRSDVLKAYADVRSVTPHIPFTTVVLADDPDDFGGATYRALKGGTRLPVEHSWHDELLFSSAWSPDEVTPVHVRQLRYVEAPMVRGR